MKVLPCVPYNNNIKRNKIKTSPDPKELSRYSQSHSLGLDL